MVSRRLPAPRGVTEEERSGDCDIHHAAVRPGRRQHARAAREDPAARDRRRDRGRRGDPARRGQEWFWLTVLVLVTLAIFVVYLQPWHIPLKYIVPGTIFLIAFQVVPVVSTFGVSFTNFGDGHRGIEGGRDHGDRRIVGQAGPGLRRVRPDDRDAGRRRDREPPVPALRPGHQDRPGGHAGRPDAVHRLHDRADRQGHGGRRPDAAQPRPGGRAVAPTSRRSASRPTTARSGPRVSARPTRASRPRPTTRPATASPTRPPGRSTPRTTPGAASSMPRPARRCRRAGRSTSASATTPGRSPTPRSPGRSSASSAGTSRSRSSTVVTTFVGRPAGGDRAELAAAPGAAVLPRC